MSSERPRPLVAIEDRDIFTLDLSQGPTVVTLYLLPSLNARLLPQLRKLPEGAALSVGHRMADIPPDQQVTVDTEDGDYTIYLWRVETLRTFRAAVTTASGLRSRRRWRGSSVDFSNATMRRTLSSTLIARAVNPPSDPWNTDSNAGLVTVDIVCSVVHPTVGLVRNEVWETTMNAPLSVPCSFWVRPISSSAPATPRTSSRRSKATGFARGAAGSSDGRAQRQNWACRSGIGSFVQRSLWP